MQMLACRIFYSERCTNLVTVAFNFALEYAVTEISGKHYEVALNEKGQRLTDVYTLINHRLLYKPGKFLTN